MTDAENETDIARVFRTSPDQHTKVDRDAIVAKLRTQRKQFVAGIKTAGTPASKVSKTTKTQAAAVAVTGDIDLSDLGL